MTSMLPPIDAHPLLTALRERVVLVDGGMGTSLQNAGLTTADFGSDDLDGCNQVVV